MENELKLLKTYLTLKKEVEVAIKSFKFNLNLIDHYNLNALRLARLLFSIQQTCESLIFMENQLASELKSHFVQISDYL